MEAFRDMPINRKLSVVILLTCTLALLLTGIVVVGTEYIASRGAIAEETQVMADLLGRNSTAPLSFHRPEDADEISNTLSALAADPHVEAAAVYDNAGAIFGKYQRRDITDDLPQQVPRDGYAFVDHAITTARPILLNNQRLGTMYLRVDLGRMYDRIILHASVVMGVFLLCVLAILLITPRLRRPIAEPILQLARVARRVASEKDYSQRVQKQGGDEVGVLTDAFNHMLQETESAQSTLVQTNESMQREIDERKAAEDRLRKALDDLAKARDVAESANKAKDQFLAVLSHELRTPLTPVLLTLSLLERSEEQFTEEVREDLQTIRRHVELEARLIDDLLDMTRIARGKISLNLQTIDLHRLLHDAAAISFPDDPDLKLDLHALHHHVSGDNGRLLQIFWNLLNNARKFTPQGGTIRVTTDNPTNGKIVIEVSDNGVGIEPAIIPKLFNAFVQADASFNRQFGGLGLGLSIAKALVDLHGGAITVRSEGKGTGSTFRVELNTTAATPTLPND